MTSARILTLGATAALLLSCKGKAAAGGPGGGEGAGGFALPVEVAAARQDTVVDAVLATGQVEAIQSAELRPEVDGRITEILMREGSEVGQGDPLFRVDDQEIGPLMKTVHRADIHTIGVFALDAIFGDNIGHGTPLRFQVIDEENYNAFTGQTLACPRC